MDLKDKRVGLWGPKKEDQEENQEEEEEEKKEEKEGIKFNWETENLGF